MSGSVVEAETALARCVEAMREALLAAVVDALPQSTGSLGTSGAEAELVDTAAQRLEWEAGVEQRRIAGLIDELDRHFGTLERVVASLPDTPVAVVDRDIERLNAEASSLAQAMIAAYDEAEALAARIEHEILSQPVPSV